MASRPEVFISATSADLGTFRQAVRDALLTAGAHPVLQEHFPPDYRSVVEMLRDKIDQCDAVICFVGFVYGQEPRDRPLGAPRRSYTQLEYDIAVALGKPVYLFLAGDGCPFDATPDEADELRDLQLAHRGRLTFQSQDELTQHVARIRFPKTPARRRGRPLILPPPTPYFAHPYPLQENFTGRARERKMLTEWLTRGRPRGRGASRQDRARAGLVRRPALLLQARPRPGRSDTRRVGDQTVTGFRISARQGAWALVVVHKCRAIPSGLPGW